MVRASLCRHGTEAPKTPVVTTRVAGEAGFVTEMMESSLKDPLHRAIFARVRHQRDRRTKRRKRGGLTNLPVHPSNHRKSTFILGLSRSFAPDFTSTASGRNGSRSSNNRDPITIHNERLTQNGVYFLEFPFDCSLRQLVFKATRAVGPGDRSRGANESRTAGGQPRKRTFTINKGVADSLN